MKWKEVKPQTKGPVGTKALHDSAKAAIEELQEKVGQLLDGDESEEVEIYMIEDGDLVKVTVKGFVSEHVEN